MLASRHVGMCRKRPSCEYARVLRSLVPDAESRATPESQSLPSMLRLATNSAMSLVSLGPDRPWRLLQPPVRKPFSAAPMPLALGSVLT